MEGGEGTRAVRHGGKPGPRQFAVMFPGTQGGKRPPGTMARCKNRASGACAECSCLLHGQRLIYSAQVGIDSQRWGERTAGVDSFAATHWTVVRAAAVGRVDNCAGDGDPGAAHLVGDAAREAFSKLCSLYWYPLYAFVRRSGHSRPDAQDLTQDFFVRLIESRLLNRADPQRGKFRSFLLAALKNFLRDDHDRRSTQRRGRGFQVISLDVEDDPEARYQLEALRSESNAETFYETRWATAVVEAALGRLRADLAIRGRAHYFDALHPLLSSGEDSAALYAASAVSLGLSLSGLRSVTARLRQQYRQLLREEVSRTVEETADIDQEIRHLCAVLAVHGP